MRDCGGNWEERQSLPTSEILDAHLDSGGRPRWSCGPAYADPYLHDELRFSGEVYLHATSDTGNYKGFRRDVLRPLRSAAGLNYSVI